MVVAPLDWATAMLDRMTVALDLDLMTATRKRGDIGLDRGDLRVRPAAVLTTKGARRIATVDRHDGVVVVVTGRAMIAGRRRIWESGGRAIPLGKV